MDKQISDLMVRALGALKAGNAGVAQTHLSAVIALEPNHPLALYHLGILAWQQGSSAHAEEMLSRAMVAAPSDPMIAFSLSVLRRDRGDLKGEAQALSAALTADPYFLPALFNKGAHFERQGQKRLAAQAYRNALKTIAPGTVLRPEIEALAKHAREIVAGTIPLFEAFADGILARVKSEHEGANWQRIEECAHILSGRARAHHQEPTALYFPGLAPLAFHDRASHQWADALEALTPRIRDEYRAAQDEAGRDFKPYVALPAGAPVNQWTELNHSARWSTYHLWRHGEPCRAEQSQCPVTAAALRTLPLADLPGFCPNAMFSVLAPGTRIPPHTGETNARLVVHLPLIVPSGCRFRVGNHWREWREGEVLIFDDSIEHEAVNDSAEPRVVLIVDIWNPQVSVAEQEGVIALLKAHRDFYAP